MLSIIPISSKVSYEICSIPSICSSLTAALVQLPPRLPVHFGHCAFQVCNYLIRDLVGECINACGCLMGLSGYERKCGGIGINFRFLSIHACTHVPAYRLWQSECSMLAPTFKHCTRSYASLILWEI